MICLVLAVFFVLSATPVLAESNGFYNDNWWTFPGETYGTWAAAVTGGPSQKLVSNAQKDEPNSMDVHISQLDLNGQSNFRFRGYVAGTNTTCTVACQITGTGYHAATYTSHPDYCDMKMSIASGSTSDKVYFNGWWAV